MEMKEKRVSEFKIVELCLNNIIIGIATEIGPRILYVAGKDKPDFNFFGVLPEVGDETPRGFWRIYGGHRLWISPEDMLRTYSMDDKPIKIEESKNDSILIWGNPEKENSVQKQIEIKPYLRNGIEVIHRIKNIGKRPISLACWGLSVMRQKGFAVIPFNAGQKGLLPDRRLSIWPYTKFSDERLTLRDEYIFVQQKPSAKQPIKIGTIAHPSWLAYCIAGKAFVLSFSREEGEYPDFGCNVEVYTNADFLELETLSPLKTIKSSEYVQHTEIWNIYDVGEIKPTTKSVENKLSGLVDY
jgi:hypothetical protein